MQLSKHLLFVATILGVAQAGAVQAQHPKAHHDPEPHDPNAWERHYCAIEPAGARQACLNSGGRPGTPGKPGETDCCIQYKKRASYERACMIADCWTEGCDPGSPKSGLSNPNDPRDGC